MVVGQDVWLLTEREPATDWVRNLRLEPAVTLEVAGRSFSARADVVEIEPEHKVRAALATRYASAGDDLADWASEALAVRVSVSSPGARGATTRTR